MFCSKKTGLRYFLFGVILGVLLLFTNVVMAQELNDPAWTDIESGSKEEAELNYSMALTPPDDTRYSIESIKKMGEAVHQTDYPNANAVYLVSRDRTAFDVDGRYHLILQEAIKILSDTGVDEFGNATIRYSLPYDRIRILEAFIILTDGSVISISPDEIIDIPDSQDAESNIYEPIWRMKVIAFPKVEPGVVICYTYEECTIRPRTPGILNWGHTFRTSEPILEASVYLKGPSSMPAYWHISNDPDNQVTFWKEETGLGSSGNFTTYCWKSQNLPIVISESGMIPIEELQTQLFFSTVTWEEFSRREAVLIEPNLVPDEAIRAKVLELTQHISDPLAKLHTLFQYVTKKVRYMGVAYGDRPGVDPDPVSRTFANNAGVCKDKAGLLTAMLRLADIEAYYSLNNPTIRIQQKTAVDQFDHAIVAARLPGESEFRYLDVTTDLERSMCPASSGGTSVLRIDRKGAPIETIPISGPELNMGRLEAVSTIDEQGNLASQVHYSGDGIRDVLFREPLYYVEPGKHLEWFGYFLKDLAPTTSVTQFSFSPQPLDDLTQTMTFYMTFLVPGYVIKANKYHLFKMPEALFIFDWIYSDALESASLPSRKNPLNLQTNSGMTVRETMSIPSTYRVKAIPNPIQIESGGIRFQQSYRVEPHSIILDQLFEITQPRIPPEEYGAFKSALSEIQKSTRSYIILETDL